MVSQSKLGTGVTTSPKKIYAVPVELHHGYSKHLVLNIYGLDGTISFIIDSPSTDNKLICLEYRCSHLNGGSWRFVYGNNKPVKNISKFIGVELC